MDSKVEKKIEKEIDKQIEKKIEKEVEKRLSNKVYEKTRKSAKKFRNEFKKQTIIAISAAFSFLIALSWRTPIQNTIDAVIKNLKLTGSAVYIEYLSAIIITIIAVFILMWFSKDESVTP